MKKFKYKIVKTQTEIPESKLNILGGQGWELCGVFQDIYGFIYYIKKEIEKSDGKSNI